MLKVRQKTWCGDVVTESISDAVERELANVGGHGYGQVEQLGAELDATQKILFRLIDVLSDSLDVADVFKLLDRIPEDTFHKIEVIEEED